MGASDSWSTTDLGTAAYGLSRGLKIRDIQKDKGEVTYSFEDPEQKGKQFRFEYANSPERKHDESVRALKRLTFGNQADRPRR